MLDSLEISQACKWLCWQDELSEDHLALATACEADVTLCTIVGITGSFSRRLGAQLACHANGGIVGNLSDGCLEQQLASDSHAALTAEVRRYGSGSPLIDFRLPCGGGLDILIDPAPDRAACRSAIASLRARRPASLALPPNGLLAQRSYIPALRIRVFGVTAELAPFISIAQAANICVEGFDKRSLALGRASGLGRVDPWTAVVMLFHDHEWEYALLEEALDGEPFYVGAQGGSLARARRMDEMRRRGCNEARLGRIRSPIGLSPASRTPQALAISILAEIMDEYERLHTVS